MEPPKPRWTTASYLLYLGMFTVFGAAVGAYAYLSAEYGDAAFVGWTALMLATLLLLAVVLRRRGPWLAGGLFAYLSVTAWGTFVGALFQWWGWTSNQGSVFGGWHWAAWGVALLVLIGLGAARQATHFPLLVLPSAVIGWYLVTDIVSGGGSWSAVVTLLVGFAYFFAGLAVNRVTGFWLHVVSALLVGGALLYWWHSTTADWAAVGAAGFVFVVVGTVVRRSSWAVVGSLGLLASATYFAIKHTTGVSDVLGGRPPTVWVPIVVAAVLGFLYVALGLVATRRSE